MHKRFNFKGWKINIRFWFLS